MLHENLSNSAKEDTDEETEDLESHSLFWRPFMTRTGFSLISTVDICAYCITTACLREVLSQAKSKQKIYSILYRLDFCYWPVCDCLSCETDSFIFLRMSA